jgi:hypothetical protein
MPGGRGGKGGGAPQPRDVLVSKKLSWLLRHGAEKEGLVMGKGGYINLDEVVCYVDMCYMLQDIDSCVEHLLKRTGANLTPCLCKVPKMKTFPFTIQRS